MSAGKRVNLSSMRSAIAPAATPPTAAPATPTRDVTPTPAPQHVEAARPPKGRAALATPPTAGAKWTQLERKEARIREDQATYLADTRKRLNKTRAGTGERLTDNSLLRVAIDLLAHHDGQLAGATEDELRASLGLNRK